MEFKVNEALPILERTPEVVSLLLRNLPDSWIYQNEGGETWTPFDVIGHYIQGERTDWIPRMNIILNVEDKHFVRFDRFAQFRESEVKTLDQFLDEFSDLRKENVKKLRRAQLDEQPFTKRGKQ